MGEDERDFSSTVIGEDSDSTDEPSVKKLKEDQTDTNSTADAGASNDMKGSQKWINEKWVFRYTGTDNFMTFDDVKGWTAIPEDEVEFIDQLWQEQEAIEKQQAAAANGGESEVNEDFLAQYNLSYGVEYDYEKMARPADTLAGAGAEEIDGGEPEKKKKTKEELKKEKAERKIPRPAGWVDMEEKVHAVYVSGLPLDIEEKEFTEIMTKCGVIASDARTHKPKIKLYRDEEGNVKGDGRACYVRKESVDLALSLIDESDIRGKKIHVERAHFEMKGDYDPKKKRRKLTAAQKKRYMEQQNRHFEWRPDKSRNYRPVSDCTVVIKRLFTLDEMIEDASRIFSLKEELSKSCATYGNVKKVVVYDNNPDGVATVSFDSTDGSDQAVKMLNGRPVRGRNLEAALWDGKTKYKVVETEEQAAKRLEHWNKFIESGGKKDDSSDEKKIDAHEKTPEKDDEEVKDD
ncbi:cus-2 [Pristionchus pacificus]|uniref:17S U2 SnRNP complex component HTATSF1 n=1 Tax=Pristionchus pacificus TaxID=54126 RepID=A0A8R1U961_PRIPA|nr:cus-2 [Pristionchus pacificus]